MRREVFGVFFSFFSPTTIGGTKPRIQHWIEFILAYNGNFTADLLSQLPFPPTEEDASGFLRPVGPVRPCRLSNLLILPYAWHWVGSTGILLAFCRGLGLGELIPQLDPLVSGGLLLTHDIFHTHCAPLPP